MSELSIGYVIKIILVLLVIVVIIGGIYLFFKNSIIGFFQNIPSGNVTNIIISLIK